METGGCPVTSKRNCQLTLRNIPEDWCPYSHCGGTLKLRDMRLLR